jgi:hypothetical protein
MTRAVAIVVVVLTVLTAPSTAWPQPVPSADSAEDLTHSRPLQYRGADGFWFPRDATVRLLQQLEELASLRIQTHDLEQKVALKLETVQLLRDNLRYTQQQSDHWRAGLMAAVRATRPPSRSLWESPTFWFFTGFVSAAVLAVGLTFGLQQAAGD